MDAPKRQYIYDASGTTKWKAKKQKLEKEKEVEPCNLSTRERK